MPPLSMTDCKFHVWFQGCTKSSCPFRHPSSKVRETTPICKFWLRDFSCNNKNCLYQHPAEDLIKQAQSMVRRRSPSRSRTPSPRPNHNASRVVENIKSPSTPTEPAIPVPNLIQLINESFGDQNTIKQVTIAQHIKDRTGKTWKECSGNISFKQFFEKYLPDYIVRSEGIGLEKVTRPSSKSSKTNGSLHAVKSEHQVNDFIHAVLDKSMTSQQQVQVPSANPSLKRLLEQDATSLLVEPAAKRQRLAKDMYAFYFGASATPNANPEQCMAKHVAIHAEILAAYQQY